MIYTIVIGAVIGLSLGLFYLLKGTGSYLDKRFSGKNRP